MESCQGAYVAYFEALMFIKLAAPSAPSVPMVTEPLRHKPDKKWVHSDVVGHPFGKKVNAVVDKRGCRRYSALAWHIGVHDSHFIVGDFPTWLKEESLSYLGRALHDIAVLFAHALSEQKTAKWQVSEIEG